MLICYQILGLDDTACDQEIRTRYLDLVKVNPPESKQGEFIRITQAYEAIKDRPSRIRSQLTGYFDYANLTEALTDLVTPISHERQTPGLWKMKEADQK